MTNGKDMKLTGFIFNDDDDFFPKKITCETWSTHNEPIRNSLRGLQILAHLPNGVKLAIVVPWTKMIKFVKDNASSFSNPIHGAEKKRRK